MNGAESLIATLVDHGVEVCFANPGTSEMHFVAALDEVPGMRCILGLFEGVLSGAADGYAKMAGKPACTLLHLGPGLGNAVANLHNARKGHVPVVNIVGDHASYHLRYDAPLTSDLEGIARPVSHWLHTSGAAAEIARDAAEAVRQAGRSRVATLILPADVSWGDNPAGRAPRVEVPGPDRVPEERLQRATELLRNGKSTLLLVGGPKITLAQGLLLNRISQATGARVMVETFPGRIRRGAGSAPMERLPYLAEMALDALQDVEQLLLVGAGPPVSFFAYPDVPGILAPAGAEQLQLVAPGEDLERALRELAQALGAERFEPETCPLTIPEPATGALDANSAAQSLAHYLPENAIVVDEGITSVLACYPLTAGSRPHDWLCLTGGSIGWGLPAAVGAAVACPQRKVVCLEGDGSAMYTIQALWTMAREGLDVTVVIFNNRKYSILELEFGRTGARGGTPGPKAAGSLALDRPDLDFVALAGGMGVSATRACDAAQFNAALEEAMAARGPRLIEAVVPTLF